VTSPVPEETPDAKPVNVDCAEHLRKIADDLRSAGDIPLVALSEEGVTRQWVTLADELWLIALRLDGRLNSDQELPAQ
jgi:hypothetical protein